MGQSHPYSAFVRYRCGPEENRTLHTFLAREHRQPWYMQAHNFAGEVRLELTYREGQYGYLLTRVGFTDQCRYSPIYVLLTGFEPVSPP